MRKTMQLLTICLAACLGWSSLWAAEIPVIDTQTVKTKLDQGATLLLLNSLSDIEFSEGYIPGSVNIPLHDLETTDKLPADKNTLIISYCMGPK